MYIYNQNARRENGGQNTKTLGELNRLRSSNI
jgi:hypothetical protein